MKTTKINMPKNQFFSFYSQVIVLMATGGALLLSKKHLEVSRKIEI